MDTAIRNAEIRAFWEGLSFTDKTYRVKIDIIQKKYFISDKLIESIIARSPIEN